jgi:protein required for attachment to host cells
MPTDRRTARTWIVIADGAHARVLEHVPGTPGLQAVSGMVITTALPRTHDLVSDRAGRSFESQGPTRHAKAGRSDPHRELKRGTARALAAMLKAGLAERRYQRLVLVAPPTALGDMRAALAKDVRALVAAEIAQDLVKAPQKALSRHLAHVLSDATARAVAPRTGARAKA